MSQTVPADEWLSVTQDFHIANLIGNITACFTPEGKIVMVLIRTNKQEPIASGLCDQVSVLTNILLERGIPFAEIAGMVKSKLLSDEEDPDSPELRSFVSHLFEKVAEIKPPTKV